MSTHKASNAKVQIAKDGPYLVSGGLPLSKQTIGANSEGESVKWVAGRAYPAQASYALCRCGHSANKPFCDGSHNKAKFDGTETASREPYQKQAKVLQGPVLSLTDAEQLCAFARFCDPHGQVWNLVNETDNPGCPKEFRAPGGRLPLRTFGGLGKLHRKVAGTELRAIDRFDRGPCQRVCRAGLVEGRRAGGRRGWISI
jgi:CDGSH-type Zn-finger protein